MKIMPKITELYAWVVTESPGNEGVPGGEVEINGKCVLMPMMGADLERAQSLREMAVQIARLQNMPLKLIRSTAIEVVEVVKPE